MSSSHMSPVIAAETIHVVGSTYRLAIQYSLLEYELYSMIYKRLSLRTLGNKLAWCGVLDSHDLVARGKERGCRDTWAARSPGSLRSRPREHVDETTLVLGAATGLMVQQQ